MDDLELKDFDLNMGFDEYSIGENDVNLKVNTWVICATLTNITEDIDCATAGITATF